MKKAAADTSSIIILEKAGILEIFAGAYTCIIGPVVLSELQQKGSSSLYSDVCKIVPSITKGRHGETGSLSGGEKEAVSLYYSHGADFVLIDDKEGVAFCRSRGIPHINALLAPHLLFHNSCITEEERHAFIEAVYEHAWYSDHVKQYEANVTGKDLAFFLLK